MFLQNLRNIIKPGIWIIAIAFGVSLFFMYGRSALQGEKQKSLVEVNGVAISYQSFVQSYQSIYERYREQSQEEISPQVEEYLKSQVLLELIKNELLWQETKRAKVQVSQEELNEAIRGIMQPFGSQEAFMRFLDSRHILYADLEEDVRKQLAINRLTQTIGNSVAITDEEAKNDWIMQNERIGVSYIIVEPEKYKKEVKISQQEIEKYYEEYQEDFTVSEKVKVDYILIKPEDFIEKVSDPSKEDLESYYQKHLASFEVPEERRTSHILIKIADSSSEENGKKAREKIERIEKELKEGADFAALAKKYSEDSSSAKEGGDLGFFRYYEMVPSFSEAAFSLEEVGQISEIVKTPFGYHLIKLIEIKPGYIRPFQEAEKELEQMWKKEKSETLAQEEANNTKKEIEEKRKTFEQYVIEYSGRINTTPFFAQGVEIENLGWLPQFNQAAFSLKPGEISSVVKIPEGYSLLRLREKKPSYISSFQDVSEKIKEKLIEEKTMEITEKKANEITTQIKGEDLASFSKEWNLKYKSLESLKRTDWIEGMSSEDRQQFIKTAFSLREGEISKPLQLPQGYYIMALDKRELSLDDFSQQEELKENLLAQKRAHTLNLWFEQIWKKAKIVDNSSLFFSP